MENISCLQIRKKYLFDKHSVENKLIKLMSNKYFKLHSLK